MLPKRLFWPLPGLLGVLLSTPSWAAPADDPIAVARDLFRSAERDEDSRLWAEALEKLRQVAAIKFTSGVRFHVALCEEHVGQLASALSDYKEAERQAHAEDARDVLNLVGARIVAVSARVPRLAIRIAPEGTIAAVTLDGQAIATALVGTAIPVDAGQHRVQASSPDHESAVAVVTVREHESTDVVMSLEPAVPSPAPPAAAPPEPWHDPVPRAGGDGGTRLVLAAIGAVGLAALGVGAFVAAGNEVDDGVRACRQVVSTSPDACDSSKNVVREWDWVAAAAWTGAAASAAIAFFAWTRRDARPRLSSPSAGVFVGPGSLGVAGSF